MNPATYCPNNFPFNIRLMALNLFWSTIPSRWSGATQYFNIDKLFIPFLFNLSVKRSPEHQDHYITKFGLGLAGKIKIMLYKSSAQCQIWISISFNLLNLNLMVRWLCVLQIRQSYHQPNKLALYHKTLIMFSNSILLSVNQMLRRV